MSGEEPTLTRGNHRDARAGRCLMEHVSVLAGEPFGPWPRCTHPALAALAVQVNDRVSDAARDALASRAPALGRARSVDPALTWRLVEHTSRATLVHRPDDVAAARRRRRAARARRVRERALPRGLVARLPRWLPVAVALAALDELVVAVHALAAASGPAGSPARDEALVALLDTAVEVTLGRPDDFPRRSARPDDFPRRSARPDDFPRRSARPGPAPAAAPPLEEVSAA